MAPLPIDRDVQRRSRATIFRAVRKAKARKPPKYTRLTVKRIAKAKKSDATGRNPKSKAVRPEQSPD
jgi:hypothetical protein